MPAFNSAALLCCLFSIGESSWSVLEQFTFQTVTLESYAANTRDTSVVTFFGSRIRRKTQELLESSKQCRGQNRGLWAKMFHMPDHREQARECTEQMQRALGT